MLANDPNQRPEATLIFNNIQNIKNKLEGKEKDK